MKQQYKGQLEELMEKVQVYESLLHSLYIYGQITMDNPPISHALDIVCDWSRAASCGNGEISDADQETLVKRQFLRLKNREYADSVWNSKVDTIYKTRYQERQTARTKV